MQSLFCAAFRYAASGLMTDTLAELKNYFADDSSVSKVSSIPATTSAA